ncbi:MAG: iron-containing alcohol dehydrogenase [Lachnospiraceae bacterium]|nr:iron-containing alcohol dehydrogenase [Lachnospiraceae bacterium]
MNDFIYSAPTKVYFGKDQELEVGKLIKPYAPNKVLIHYGGSSAKKSGLLDIVKNALEAEDIEYVELGGVKPNPELPLVREGIKLCKENNVDFVLAVGGGSVMDSAKDIANGAANPDIDVWDFSLGNAIPKHTLNKGCILTLAAAGSEMSHSCVITNPETKDKRGYSCPCNHMNFAIENPELTFSVNKYQTACGTVDISMHTIERFFMPGDDTYLTDDIAIAVIRNALSAGKCSFNEPNNYEARGNMMWASSLAHNGLTNCGRQFQLTVHQLEHEISGLYPEVAHGAGLAALWCSWARYVYQSNIPRWLKYANEVWNIDINYEHPEETILKAIETQENFYKSIEMPIDIKSLGVKESDLEYLADKCSRSKTRILAGYKELGYEEILDIYKMAYNR